MNMNAAPRPEPLKDTAPMPPVEVPPEIPPTVEQQAASAEPSDGRPGFDEIKKGSKWSVVDPSSGLVSRFRVTKVKTGDNPGEPEKTVLATRRTRGLRGVHRPQDRQKLVVLSEGGYAENGEAETSADRIPRNELLLQKKKVQRDKDEETAKALTEALGTEISAKTKNIRAAVPLVSPEVVAYLKEQGGRRPERRSAFQNPRDAAMATGVHQARNAVDAAFEAGSDAEKGEEDKPPLSYEAAYVTTIQGLREHGKGAAIRNGFDALGSRDDSLKNLIVVDLMDLSLIDYEGNVAVPDEDLRKDQEKELASALKHSIDITGARFTTKSGATVEVANQYQDAQGTVLYDFAINTSDGIKTAQTREQMATVLEIGAPDQDTDEAKDSASHESAEAEKSQMSDSEYQQRYIGVLRELRAVLDFPRIRHEGVVLDPNDLGGNFANDPVRTKEAYKALVDAELVEKGTSKLTTAGEKLLDEQVAQAFDLLERGDTYTTPDGSEIKIVDLQAGEVQMTDARGIKSAWKNVTPEQLAEFLKKN